MNGKRQIVFIHGGDVFPDEEAFLRYLRTTELRDPLWSPDAPARWRETLARRFADRCDILMPTMPNKQSARYDEWVAWFTRHVPFLTDGAILVGHSLGGIFLSKYLTENDFPVRVEALVLVSAPFDGSNEPNRILGDFELPEDISILADRAERILLYHSKDDPVVPISEMDKYARAIPGAIATTLDGRGHILDGDFPELSDVLGKILSGAG